MYELLSFCAILTLLYQIIQEWNIWKRSSQNQKKPLHWNFYNSGTNSQIFILEEISQNLSIQLSADDSLVILQRFMGLSFEISTKWEDVWYFYPGFKLGELMQISLE